ncbi:unnamed protein product, partial [Ectocarpus sp. 8 AP-2014]
RYRRSGRAVLRILPQVLRVLSSKWPDEFFIFGEERCCCPHIRSCWGFCFGAGIFSALLSHQYMVGRTLGALQSVGLMYGISGGHNTILLSVVAKRGVLHHEGKRRYGLDKLPYPPR